MPPQSSSSRRIKNISISKPIIYGNMAQKISETNPLPEGAPADHTHTWKVFVADPLGNDLSSYIRKVVFKLHDTYNNPTRSIEEPPFEVSETGWGEFEIVIKIYFNNDCGEKNITFYHHLKLHPYGPNVEESQKTGRVESILFDEIVFNEPTERMFRLLTAKPGSLLPYKSENSKFTKEAERQEIDRIEKALEEVRKQIDQKSIEFKELEQERQRLVA
ncbi:hypothetical protein KL911_001895 [Ogataea haglerorum]|uniref:uncharacterized protein n=1 Tax=Ogataea haglerorum TaxID=1937702 RepID=UPI001C8AB36E|nr:uncharacterized protein KL911_001895 [Ogataea haglerorum]KAG7755838.1 hypothetical protein KL911_001895 [Ogataea haglerorum]